MTNEKIHKLKCQIVFQLDLAVFEIKFGQFDLKLISSYMRQPFSVKAINNRMIIYHFPRKKVDLAGDFSLGYKFCLNGVFV